MPYSRNWHLYHLNNLYVWSRSTTASVWAYIIIIQLYDDERALSQSLQWGSLLHNGFPLYIYCSFIPTRLPHTRHYTDTDRLVKTLSPESWMLSKESVTPSFTAYVGINSELIHLLFNLVLILVCVNQSLYWYVSTSHCPYYPHNAESESKKLLYPFKALEGTQLTSAKSSWKICLIVMNR